MIDTAYHSVYMFNHEAFDFPTPILHQPALPSLPLDDQTPGGGTNFRAALLKAVDIMEEHLTEKTCFILITDGESFYSRSGVSIFNSTKKKIKKNCDFCSKCYFIKDNERTIIPLNLKRICNDIGAPLVAATVQDMKEVFSNDFLETVQNMETSS